MYYYSTSYIRSKDHSLAVQSCTTPAAPRAARLTAAPRHVPLVHIQRAHATRSCSGDQKFYLQEFKFTLKDEKLEDVIQFASSPLLRNMGIHMKDFDITVGCKGVFRKHDLIYYLCKINSSTSGRHLAPNAHLGWSAPDPPSRLHGSRGSGEGEGGLSVE